MHAVSSQWDKLHLEIQEQIDENVVFEHRRFLLTPALPMLPSPFVSTQALVTKWLFMHILEELTNFVYATLQRKADTVSDNAQRTNSMEHDAWKIQMKTSPASTTFTCSHLDNTYTYFPCANSYGPGHRFSKHVLQVGHDAFRRREAGR